MDAPSALKGTAVHRGFSTLVQSTVSQHPMTFALIFAVLVLLVIILAYFVYDYRKKADATKSSMCNPIGLRSYNNLTMGGALPIWEMGSDSDQPNFTAPSSDDGIRYTQAAVFLPEYRHALDEDAHAHQCRLDVDLEQDVVSGCKAKWGPDATMEALALERLEAVTYNDGYGEANLNAVLEEGGLSDDQLMAQFGFTEVAKLHAPGYIDKPFRKGFAKWTP